MRALRIYAGPKAHQHIEKNRLRPGDNGVVPGWHVAQKGLKLGAVNRFIVSDWLATSSHTVLLVSAVIGAWLMNTACLADPLWALSRLERD